MFQALGYTHAAGAHGAEGPWALYEAQFNSGYGAALRFKFKKRAKKASKISRPGIEKMLRKHKFLRDENEDLARALGEKDLNDGKKTMLRLARLRDKMRIKAISAAEGKTAGQVTGRAYVGLLTAGTSEVARLFMKKRISKARKKRAGAFLAKANAADQLLLYWKKQFVDATKKAAKKKPALLSVQERALIAIAGKKGDKLDMLEQDGITAEMPTDVQDEKESAAEAQAEAEADAEAPAESDENSEEGLSGAQMFGYAALGFGAALLPSIIRR